MSNIFKNSNIQQDLKRLDNIKFIENMSQTKQTSLKNQQHITVQSPETKSQARSIKKQSQLHENGLHQQNDRKSQIEKSKNGSVKLSQKSMSKHQWNAAYEGSQFEINKDSKKKKNIQDSLKKSQRPISELEWDAVYHNQIFDVGQLKKNQSQASENKIQSNSFSRKNEINWQTAYIDDKFYLSDPVSLARLKQLEDQIEAERKKLANIESTEKFDQSFLSQQQLDDEDNKIDTLTQVNQSRLLKRKQNAQADLLKEQQKYRMKLQQMKKKKAILKKQIGCGTNEKNLQVDSQEIIKEQEEIKVQKKVTENLKENLVAEKGNKKSEKQTGDMQKLSPSVKRQISKKSEPRLESPQKKSVKKSEHVEEKSMKAASEKKSNSKIEKSQSKIEKSQSKMEKSQESPVIETTRVKKQQQLSKSGTKSQKSSSKQKNKQIQISLPELPEAAKSHKISGLKSDVGKSQKEGEMKKSEANSQKKSLIKEKQPESSVRTKKKDQTQKDPSIHINIIEQKKEVDASTKNINHQLVNPSIKSKEVEKDPSRKSKNNQQIQISPSTKSRGLEIQQKESSVRSKAKSKKQQILDHIQENKVLSQKKTEKVEKQIKQMQAKELSRKETDKEEVERSQKQMSAKELSRKETSKEEVERSQKQKTVISIKPSENIPKQKSDLNVPVSKANLNSFKKTDKSVQWQQIEPSVRNEQRSVQASYLQTHKQSRIKDGRSQRSRVSGSEYKSQSNYRSNNKYQTQQQKSVTPYEHEQESIKQRSEDIEAQNSQVQKQSYKYNIIQKASHNSSAMDEQKSISEIKSNQNHIKLNNHNQNDRKSEVSKKNSERSKAQKQSGKIKRRVPQEIQVQNGQQTQQQSFDEILNEGAHSQIFQKQANTKNPNQVSMSESQLTSQKRRPSFKIHSRDNSIKSKQSNSKYTSKQKNSKLSEPEQSVPQKGLANDSQSLKSQLQLKRLNLQVSQLQQKLKKVEEKQQQIFKFENNQSKAYNQYQNLEASNNGSQSASPLGKMNLTSRLKLQQKLTLEASTVQFNTFQQKLKRTAQENEKLEKLKLQEEIGRLKKIIRDMQMQKIKSIQYDPNETSKFQIRRQSIIDAQSNNNSRVSEKEKWRESLNSQMVETKRNQWNTQTVNKDTKEDFGKIIKNSPHKSQVVQAPPSPRRYNKVNASRSKQLSQLQRNDFEDQKQQAPLPLRRKAQSVQGVQGVNKNRDLTKQQIINKFEQNEKNFHQFLESSRMIGHDYQSYVEPANNSLPEVYQKNKEFQSRPQAQAQILSSSVQQPSEKKIASRNFSQIIEKLKYENPQDQISKPSDIIIGTLNMPDIPQPPNISMSQDDLLELAKKTYKIFGINVDEDQNQLCMKKYKNCVVFNFGNNQQQTILWHYSGKFYFGGWKNTSDPGQGQKIGEGLQYIPGKHIYKGQFLGGKKNGNGIVKMNNGNIYDGQWVDGTKNGRGVYFQSSTGTYYSGQWKQGKRDGYGILKFSNQEFYQGTFSKSIKHGYGIQKFINGDFYKGQYQKGKFHGKGKYCWSNGSSYEGDFVEGSRQGQGNWKSSRKGGDLYTGGYQNDKKSGYGRYLWANGCVYEGYFKNDLKNGKGRLVYQDGKQIKGSWQDGNLVSADQEARKIQEHEEQPLRRSIRASSLKNSSNPLSNSFRRPVHF